LDPKIKQSEIKKAVPILPDGMFRGGDTPYAVVFILPQALPVNPVKG
jgi:hypothetical protein